MGFSEGKCEAVVNRQLRRGAHNLTAPGGCVHPEDPSPSGHCERATFLCACELEKFVLEQGIRDENLIGQLQESIEQ